MFFDFPADGGTSIGEYLFMFLIRHLLTGSTILELGSGRGTGLLPNFYYMWSEACYECNNGKVEQCK
jgi:hypothetical protein